MDNGLGQKLSFCDDSMVSTDFGGKNGTICSTNDDCADVPNGKCLLDTLCYTGCDDDMDCNDGYSCITNEVGMMTCSPDAVTDTSCSSDADCTTNGLDGFTCVGTPGTCTPLCTEGMDYTCNALTGEGSVCVTYPSPVSVSVCDNSMVSTDFGGAVGEEGCSTDADCTMTPNGKCLASTLCYVGCDDDSDCNDGYSCTTNEAGMMMCNPDNVVTACYNDG